MTVAALFLAVAALGAQEALASYRYVCGYDYYGRESDATRRPAQGRQPTDSEQAPDTAPAAA